MKKIILILATLLICTSFVLAEQIPLGYTVNSKADVITLFQYNQSNPLTTNWLDYYTYNFSWSNGTKISSGQVWAVSYHGEEYINGIPAGYSTRFLADVGTGVPGQFGFIHVYAEPGMVKGDKIIFYYSINNKVYEVKTTPEIEFQVSSRLIDSMTVGNEITVVKTLTKKQRAQLKSLEKLEQVIAFQIDALNKQLVEIENKIAKLKG